MNRFKKEEARARSDARAGKTEAEIESIEQEEALQAEISELARKIHIEWFPEEYDHYYDSIADASDRSQGINPMNKDYIAKVNARREQRGVSPLADNGMPVSDDTWQVAYREAEARLRGSDA